jgi:HD-GYP domain-containing protein (c-di-GMP phosphodiesterase class II)
LGGSASHIQLRFAAISLIVVLVVALLAGLASRQLIQTSEEDSAASALERLAVAPIAAAIGDALADGDLSSDERGRVDAAAQGAINDDVVAVRLWSPSGEELYSAGAPALDEERSAAVGSSGARGRFGVAAESAFAVFSPQGGYIVEVAQDASVIDGRIDDAHRTTIALVALAGALVFALLQGAFWFTTRAISSDHRRLTRLYVAGEDLRASLDLSEVLSQLARDATMFAGGSHGLVALYEQESGDLLLKATFERATGNISHPQRPVEEWFLRRAIATNSAIVSAQSASAYRPFFDADAEMDSQVNVLCVPMTIRERVIGVLAILRPPVARGAAFAPLNIQQAADIAVQGAMAIEQALLFARVRAYADEVEINYDATLKALMAALDAKDDVTEGHCERVAKLTVQLARQFGVAENTLVDIERGAMLHDVGKIGVPDAVLKKPAALDEGEWEAIRKHPLLAGMMISKVGFLEGATPILLYHHERFDGTGYPFGLSGDGIPLNARIFSVVDAYDAMTSDRPYRRAMPHATAMDEIAAGSGTQFDPSVVEAFIRLMASRPDLRTRNPQNREVLHTDVVTADDAQTAA